MEKDKASMRGDMDTVNFTLRVPASLADKLRDRAKDEGRSMHNLTLRLLDKGLGRLPAKPL